MNKDYGTRILGILIGIFSFILGIFIIYLYIDEIGDRVTHIGLLGLAISAIFIVSGIYIVKGSVFYK